MDVGCVRDDLHAYDPWKFIGADGLHPKVPSKLEDAFAKPLTALKSNESL